jgi:hypothetical protein
MEKSEGSANTVPRTSGVSGRSAETWLLELAAKATSAPLLLAAPLPPSLLVVVAVVVVVVVVVGVRVAASFSVLIFQSFFFFFFFFFRFGSTTAPNRNVDLFLFKLIDLNI